MKKKVMCTLLILSVAMLSACGAAKPENDVVGFERTVVKEDVVEESVNNGEDAVDVTDVDDYALAKLSEDEIIEMFDHEWSLGNYERAATDIYIWLKNNNSQAVMDKLDWVRDNIYASGYTLTIYDENDVAQDMSRFEADEHGNVIKEEYGIVNDIVTSVYTYNYLYHGDVCVSNTCYDINGDIMFGWEAELDDKGNIVKETNTYNNLQTYETIQHSYNELGQCVEEMNTYGADGTDAVTVQKTAFEYDENGNMVKELYYNSDDSVYEVLNYVYDESNRLTYHEYCDVVDGEETPYVAFEDEYDDEGNITKQVTRDLDGSNHYEYEEYVYDKFSCPVMTKYFQHETLITDVQSEFDFLGNVVIERIEEDDTVRTNIYDYVYKLREQ